MKYSVKTTLICVSFGNFFKAIETSDGQTVLSAEHSEPSLVIFFVLLTKGMVGHCYSRPQFISYWPMPGIFFLNVASKFVNC